MTTPMTTPAAQHPLERLFIVGIPRSGSTLMAALVDSLDNALCMSEPAELFIDPDAASKTTYVEFAVQQLDDYRERAMNGEPIRDRRNADGSPTTNYMKKSWFRRGRKFRPSEGLVDTSKFGPHMLVAVKHNIPFFAVLPELVHTGIPILGIVRDPIATILSWHETGLPVAKGWMPSAAAFWPELNEIMPACKTEEIGWARIYDALCQRLLDAEVPILTYETVTTDITALESFAGRASVHEVAIAKRDRATYAGSDRAEAIRQALREHAPHALQLYPDV